MSVADRLGKGSSFNSAGRRSARGRAKAVAQGDVPAYELVRIPLDEVSPTPLNPRRNFGTDEEMTRFGEELRAAQLAACVVVTRDAYLKLWPEQEQQIGEAKFVLVNGERRYRSAAHVGLDALDFVIRDDLAPSREEFIDHLLKENLDREDFDVIERARGVQELVTACSEESEAGARTRAAQRLGKDRSWVTNQLALLRLPEEIQAMLSSGEMPERDGRLLARYSKEHPELGAADLLAYLRETKEAEARARQQEKALLQAAKQAGLPPAAPPAVLSADNTASPAPSPVSQQGALAPTLSTDNTTAEKKQTRVPSTRTAPSPTSTPPATAPTPALSTDNTDTSNRNPDTAENAGTRTTVTAPPAEQEENDAVTAALRTLMRATEHDAGVLADTLGQHLSQDVLTALLRELQAWVKTSDAIAS